MVYTLLIKRQAKKTLQSLSRPDRNRITEKIFRLGANPDDATLDVKLLQGQPFYRLRVGDWRIIYIKDNIVKVISIEKVLPRGGAYK